MTTTSRQVAEPNTILRCEVGSTVHGISVDGTDDRDEMGICLEPAEYVVGLKHFEQWVHRSQPQGKRSQPGDLDLTVYSARKWASLALKGNPSVLLPLFVPEEKCSLLDSIGRAFRERAWAFASKRAGAAFLGYMTQQRQRLMGERGQMNVKRPELVEKYGFDTKYAAHIMRLGYQGVEYLTTGRLTLPMPDFSREYILALRMGKIEFNDALTHAGELELELKDAISGSPLPKEPEYETVNTLLFESYMWWWEEHE